MSLRKRNKSSRAPTERRIRITAVRREFDPERFAGVLVAAALARLDERSEGEEETSG